MPRRVNYEIGIGANTQDAHKEVDKLYKKINNAPDIKIDADVAQAEGRLNRLTTKGKIGSKTVGVQALKDIQFLTNAVASERAKHSGADTDISKEIDKTLSNFFGKFNNIKANVGGQQFAGLTNILNNIEDFNQIEFFNVDNAKEMKKILEDVAKEEERIAESKRQSKRDTTLSNIQREVTNAKRSTDKQRLSILTDDAKEKRLTNVLADLKRRQSEISKPSDDATEVVKQQYTDLVGYIDATIVEVQGRLDKLIEAKKEAASVDTTNVDAEVSEKKIVEDTTKQIEKKTEAQKEYNKVKSSEPKESKIEKPQLLQSVDILDERDEINDAKTIAQKRKTAEEMVRAQYSLYKEYQEAYDNDGLTSKGNIFNVDYDDVLRQQSSLGAYIALYEKYGGSVDKLGKKFKAFSDNLGFTGAYQSALNEYNEALQSLQKTTDEVAQSQDKLSSEMQTSTGEQKHNSEKLLRIDKSRFDDGRVIPQTYTVPGTNYRIEKGTVGWNLYDEHGYGGHDEWITAYETLKELRRDLTLIEEQESAMQQKTTDNIKESASVLDNQQLKMDRVIKSYNVLMDSLGREHKTIGQDLSEGTENWNIRDIVSEAQRQLDTYFEDGHQNSDLKTEDIKSWKSETGKLQRFITMLEPYIDGLHTTVDHLSKYDNTIVTATEAQEKLTQETQEAITKISEPEKDERRKIKRPTLSSVGGKLSTRKSSDGEIAVDAGKAVEAEKELQAAVAETTEKIEKQNLTITERVHLFDGADLKWLLQDNYNLDESSSREIVSQFEQIALLIKNADVGGEAFYQTIEQIVKKVMDLGAVWRDIPTDDIERYRKFYNQHKKTKISYDDSYASEFGGKKEWNAVRLAHNHILTKDPTSISVDSMWSELNSTFGNDLFPLDTLAAQDKLKRYLEVYDAAKAAIANKNKELANITNDQEAFVRNDIDKVVDNIAENLRRVQSGEISTGDSVNGLDKENKGFQDIAESSEKAAQGKKKFGRANRDDVAGSIDDSIDGLEEEAKGFQRVKNEAEEAFAILREAEQNTQTGYGWDEVYDSTEFSNKIRDFANKVAQDSNMLLGNISVGTNKDGIDVANVTYYNEETKLAIRQTYELREGLLELGRTTFSQNFKSLHSQTVNYGKNILNNEIKQFDQISAAVRQIDESASDGISHLLQSKMQEYELVLQDLQEYRRAFISDPTAAENPIMKQNFQDAALQAKQLRKEINGIINDAQKFADIKEGDSFINSKILNTEELDNVKHSMIQFASSVLKGQVQITGFNAAGTEMYAIMHKGRGEIENVTIALNRGSNELVAYRTGVQNTGTAWDTLASKIAKAGKSLTQHLMSFVSIYDFVRYIKQGIQEVRNIDSALTELKKVTNETEEAYDSFLQTMSKSAGNVGSTVKDLTTSAADWARLNI